jgi:hypothetical protein
VKPRISQLDQSGATDGQAIVWDDTAGEWVPDTVGAGGSLTVQDENGNVATGVTQIDFQGSGVTAASGTGEVVVTIPGGSFTHVPAAKATRTAGDVTFTSASYTAVDTALDLTLPAVVGDIIEVGISVRADFTSNNRFIFQDAATMVSGSPVNYLSGAGASGEGVQAWLVENVNTWRNCGGSVLYTVVSGDLSGGNVTVRWLARLNVGTVSRKLSADANHPAHFFMKNLGH